MFSGIIIHHDKPTKIEKTPDSMTLTFSYPKDWQLHLGDSIAIDGVCSTVKDLTDNTFSVFYMPETLRRTTLETLPENHKYNMELPLTLSSVLGGHMVSGHVDTTAAITTIKEEGDCKVITFTLSSDFLKYVVYKGSICVNGTSLTVAAVDDISFTVSLIPYTLSHTNLGELKIHDTVNIEVDLLAKHVEKLVTAYTKTSHS